MNSEMQLKLFQDWIERPLRIISLVAALAIFAISAAPSLLGPAVKWQSGVGCCHGGASRVRQDVGQPLPRASQPEQELLHGGAGTTDRPGADRNWVRRGWWRALGRAACGPVLQRRCLVLGASARAVNSHELGAAHHPVLVRAG